MIMKCPGDMTGSSPRRSQTTKVGLESLARLEVTLRNLWVDRTG